MAAEKVATPEEERYKLVQFRIDPERVFQFRPGELKEQIMARERPPDFQWGRVAKRDLGRYYWLLSELARTLPEQWSRADLEVLMRAVPEVVGDDLSLVYGLPSLAERAGGSDRLVNVIEALTLGDRVALLDLVEQERRKVPVG